MGSKFFIEHKQQYAKKGILEYHQRLLHEHYNFLKFKIQGNILIGTGCITAKDYKNSYQVEIRCVAGFEPYCKVLEPADIVPSRDIHMYDDHSLCLHYPLDMKWSGWTKIYQYTIPWLIEWTLFYELFLVNGGHWEGPQSPVHFTENERNINEDNDD